MTAATELDTTPLYRPPDVADVAARHARLTPVVASALDSTWTEWVGHTTDGTQVRVSAVVRWSGCRVRVEVDPAADADGWDVALGYAAPAWALDALLAGLLGTRATSAVAP